MAVDRHDQPPADDNGRGVSKRQQKEKLARRRSRRASRRGDPPGARSAPAGSRRPSGAAPRSRARRTRPTRRALLPVGPARRIRRSHARRRRAGARGAARAVRDAVRVGITTDELDRICHEACIARGGYPSPLHYKGFPKSLCTSVNEVICHGIPDDRVLDDGDIVNCDVTIFLNGVHGDCNATFLVGDVDDEGRRPRAGHEGSAVEGHRPGAPGRADQRHRPRDPDARGGRRLRRRALVRRPRHRRGVPHRAVGARTTTTRRADLVLTPGHDVHDRADDQRGLVGARPHLVRRLDRADTATVPAPRSSSTACSSPPTGAEVLTLLPGEPHGS